MSLPFPFESFTPDTINPPPRILPLPSRHNTASHIMPVQKPAFDALPLRKDGPHGNAWGLFGHDDQIGMLNLLTPETKAAAAREISDGTAVSTDLPLDYMSRPCFGRAPLQRSVRSKAPRTVNDDTLMFNTQSSSQWDGFRHYGYQEEKVYYGGRTQKDIADTNVNGIHGTRANLSPLSQPVLRGSSSVLSAV